MSLNNIELIEDKVAFKFLEEVDSAGFSGKSKSGIIVKQDEENQVNQARWGIVIQTAPSVTEVTEGEYILVEPLGWTSGLEIDESDEEKFWITTESRIMAVSDEAPKDV